MIKFKKQSDKNKLYCVHPILFMIVADASQWWHARGHDFVITETITNEEIDNKAGRVSASHRECRAVDVRAKDLPKDLLFRFSTLFNNKYKDHAAIGGKTLMPRLVLLHGEGENYHMHIQIHNRYAIKEEE